MNPCEYRTQQMAIYARKYRFMVEAIHYMNIDMKPFIHPILTVNYGRWNRLRVWITDRLHRADTSKN